MLSTSKICHRTREHAQCQHQQNLRRMYKKPIFTFFYANKIHCPTNTGRFVNALTKTVLFVHDTNETAHL